MDLERLCRMANDIARYYAAEPDASVAAAEVASHLRRFWEPRMRAEISAHARSGGAGLSELARQAVERLGA